MPLLHWLPVAKTFTAPRKRLIRLLEEVLELSCGNRDPGNMLVQGNNLDALQALLPYYAGKVKLTVAWVLPGVAVTPVGAPGTVAGVTWVEEPDRGDRSQSCLSPVL